LRFAGIEIGHGRAFSRYGGAAPLFLQPHPAIIPIQKTAGPTGFGGSA
jgi:hypothetical protein